VLQQQQVLQQALLVDDLLQAQVQVDETEAPFGLLDPFSKAVDEPPKQAAPKFRVTKAVAQAVLTMDDVYRRQQTWPLLGPEELSKKIQQLCTTGVDEGKRKKKAVFGAAPPAGKEVLVPPPIDPAFCSIKGQHGYRGNAMGLEPLNNKNVEQILFTWFPRLEDVFEYAGERIIAAGGAVVEAIRKASTIGDDAMPSNYQSRPHGDVDLFVVGVKEADAAAFLIGLWEAAFVDGAAEEKVKKKFQLKHLTRGQHVITISMGNSYWDCREYQIILRLYDSVDQVLGGFDLGNCAAGYNTRVGVVMTPLCQFSLACSVILVDSSRRSTSMEYRLSKYQGRGFSLVFTSVINAPEAPPAPEGEKAKPTTFRVGVMDINRNGSSFSIQQKWRIKHEKDEEVPMEPEDNGGDYDGDEHPVVMAYRNILQANKDDDPQFSKLTLTAANMKDLIEKPTIPGAANIEQMFQARANRNYYVANEPILDLYKKWFREDAEAFVVAKMRKDRATIDTIVAKTVVKIKTRLEDASKELQKPLEWITIDPGRQWTGSFKPIRAPPTDFYPKELYSPTLIGLPSLELAYVVTSICKKYGFPRDLKKMLIGEYIIPAYCQEVINAELKMQKWAETPK
jgi:hypothetical protein